MAEYDLHELPTLMTQKIFYYAGKIVHPFFVEQYSRPPAGFEAIFPESSQGKQLRKDFTLIHNFRKPLEKFNRSYRRFLPRLNYHNPNPPEGIELIHSAQRLLYKPETNYVVDFEQIGAFGFHVKSVMDQPLYRNKLLNAFCESKLKAILPWTEMALKSLKFYMGDFERKEMVLEKTKIVYPAIEPKVDLPKKMTANQPFRLLFVGSPLLYKGGYETIEAVKQLSCSISIRLDVVTKCKVEDSFNDPSIHIHSRLSFKDLQELYRDCHALIMPQHLDTLGFVIFEAFANAMPVIATRNFSTDEIITHDSDGLLVENPVSFWDANGIQKWDWWEDSGFEKEIWKASKDLDYLNSLKEAIIHCSKNLERFSQNALEKVSSGKLSFKHRNETLAQVYQKSIAQY